jgi:hypothetical protein
MFKIVGRIKNRKYVSRKHYRTQESALKAAYDMVYKRDGNHRRKNQLHDFYIEKV